MEDFRKRPKGDFFAGAEWTQLYALTKHWISDLQFFKDDMNFLNKLIDKYFIWITSDDNMEAVTKIQENLRKTRNKCTDLLVKTEKHLQQLGYMIEKEKEDSRIFRLEHEHLENEITDFVKDFRKNRREVFHITEHIMDSEQFTGLAGN